MDMTQVLLAAISLISAILTGIAIPLIKAKTTDTQWQTIQSWTKTAVAAAEVLYKGSGRGEEKRNYVLGYLKDMCEANGIKYDDFTLRNALEQAWLTIKSTALSEVA